MDPAISYEQQQKPVKIVNSIFISVFFANMALGFGRQMSNSLLAKYADSMGAEASQIGLLMGMFAITALSFRFIAGPAMDTYNRKYLLIGAMSIMTVAYLGFSISRSIQSLMCFRLLQGCGNAFGNAVCIVMISEALPKEKFSTGMGYYSLAQVIVQAIAPSVGLYMVDLVGYSVTYVINGGIMTCAIVVASRIKIHFKRTKAFRISPDTIIAREAILPAIILLLLAIGFNTINSFLIVFAGKQGVSRNIGLFFTVYAITLLFTRPMVGRLTDKYGLVKIVIPAILCTASSFIIISFSRSLPLFLVAAFVNAFGYGACQPAIQSLSMKTVPSDRRGSAGSTNYIGTDTGTIIGPILAGTIAQYWGYFSMWRFQIIPFIVAIFVIFCNRRRITKIEKDFLAMNEGAA
jgi:MFS family permease